MICQDYFLQIRHSHFPDGPVVTAHQPAYLKSARDDGGSMYLQIYWRGFKFPWYLKLGKLGSIFNFPSISSIFLINFSVFKLEKSFESHIKQQEVLFEGYFSLFGFYQADYSWVSDCFLMLDIKQMLYASIQPSELVDPVNERIVIRIQI